MLPRPSRGPKGMPRPWHPTHGACHALAMLPLPLRHPACYGLGCVPPGALLPAPRGMPARPRKQATALAACLGLGCCMHAQALAAACSPKPWMLHAHALAAECPWGAALALAAACPCLGCLPMGAALALAAARLGQAVGIPGACPRARHAASPRIVPHSSKIGSCLFLFLCS